MRVLHDLASEIGSTVTFKLMHLPGKARNVQASVFLDGELICEEIDIRWKQAKSTAAIVALNELGIPFRTNAMITKKE